MTRTNLIAAALTTMTLTSNAAYSAGTVVEPGSQLLYLLDSGSFDAPSSGDKLSKADDDGDERNKDDRSGDRADR